MTEFKSPHGEIKLTVNPSRDGSLLRLGLSATSGDGAEPGYGVEAVFNADLARAIAAAVLEAAGYGKHGVPLYPTLTADGRVENGHSIEPPDSTVARALALLKVAIEANAKPRVTDAQVAAVRKLAGLDLLSSGFTCKVLQAALDSGLFAATPPAEAVNGE